MSCEELIRRLTNRKTRGIAAKKGMTVADIFRERSPYYEKYADYRVKCDDMHIEDVVAKIIEEISGAGGL